MSFGLLHPVLLLHPCQTERRWGGKVATRPECRFMLRWGSFSIQVKHTTKFSQSDKRMGYCFSVLKAEQKQKKNCKNQSKINIRRFVLFVWSWTLHKAWVRQLQGWPQVFRLTKLVKFLSGHIATVTYEQLTCSRPQSVVFHNGS